MTNNETSKEKKSTDGVPPTDVILPNAKVAFYLHTIRLPITTSHEKEEAKKKLLEEIERDEMLPLYKASIEEFHWDIDQEFVDRLTAANEKEKEALHDARHVAEENFGDVEVKDCYLSEAHFLCRIGDFDKAIAAYDVAYKKTVGSGGRLDITLTLIRLGLLFGNQKLIIKNLEKAKIDCEHGGDWERRNKLKIYEAYYLALNRRFAQAATLFLDCIAIFAASELVNFTSFVFTSVLLGLMTLDRPSLKKQVVSSPEVAQVLEEQIVLKRFLHSFYTCDYSSILNDLVKLSDLICRDFFLHKHTRLFVRSLRLNLFKQYLEPFRSVTLTSMANAFQCPLQFLETDVSDFIANGKLICKIDRVNGVISCSTTQTLNEKYSNAIKKGDLLLSKIQKSTHLLLSYEIQFMQIDNHDHKIAKLLEKFVLLHPPERLSTSFFDGDNPLTIAKALLGCLIWTSEDAVETKADDNNDLIICKESSPGRDITVGQITELEAYVGPDDRASHAYGNKKTKRNSVMFGRSGVAYIYLCYGINVLINIVTNKEGIPHAILLRAIMPVAGLRRIVQNRTKRCTLSELVERKTITTSNEFALLGRGPGCLTRCLGITMSDNGRDVIRGNRIWITKAPNFEETFNFILTELGDTEKLRGKDLENHLHEFWIFSNPSLPDRIRSSPRIGVDYAGEDAMLPYRYYYDYHKSVCKVPRTRSSTTTTMKKKSVHERKEHTTLNEQISDEHVKRRFKKKKSCKKKVVKKNSSTSVK